MSLLTKQEVAKLLGRALSTKEDAAFEEYIDIAGIELEEILDIRLDETTGERVYPGREDYRTLFIDPFTAVTSVEVDDEAVAADDYRIAQNDRRSAAWYNSIVFDDPMGRKDVTVLATWGFGDNLPNDLKLLIARMFAVVGNANVSGQDKVRSKSIEDFSVTYDTSKTSRDQFMTDNARTIAKYQRPQSDVLHGGC